MNVALPSPPRSDSSQESDHGRSIELPKVKQKKKGKSENPFSFKKFLSGSGSDVKSSTSSSSSSSKDDGGIKPHSEGIGLSNPSDLPDFVQDHYSETPGLTTNFSIKDNISRQSISPDIGDRNTSPLDDHSIDRQRSHSENDSDFSDDEDQKTNEHSSRINTLPDFLSDGAIGNHGNLDCGRNVLDRGSDELGEIQDGNILKVRKLQEENARFRRQLEEMKIKHAEDEASLVAMREQLVVQKRKEEEETAAMEKAMEQVERNLSDTTKRAVQAETVVTKLKQEVKALQAEVKSLRMENKMLHSGDQYVLDIKERTSYVAEQLSTATKSAETSLRQMLSGLDNLKLLSQVLNSIDKITEEKSSPDSQQDLQGETT